MSHAEIFDIFFSVGYLNGKHEPSTAWLTFAREWFDKADAS